MDTEDPYGLPRFADEESLEGWTDQSEIALRSVRVFTRGPLTAVIISHPGVWDVIVSDGSGGVEFLAMRPGEITETLRSFSPTAG